MPDNPYESSKLLAEYLLFHYGQRSDLIGPEGQFLPDEVFGFPAQLVGRLAEGVDGFGGARALDIGCAVGASSFRLSENFDSVLGVDFSASFIGAAEVLRTAGRIEAEVIEEGRRTTPFVAKRPAGSRAERISFAVGDAMDLPADWTGFDLVLAANLICRLPRPQGFLQRLPSLVRPGGLLFLTTPFTWLEEFTPTEHWLGGQAGGPASKKVLVQSLSGNFILEAEMELPFLIRETARKFQLTLAWGTRWRRVS